MKNLFTKYPHMSGGGYGGYRPSTGVTRLLLVRAGSHGARMKRYVVKECSGQMMTYECDGWVDKRLYTPLRDLEVEMAGK